MDKLLLLVPLLLPGALCDLPATFSVTSYNLVLNVSADLNAAVEGEVAIILTCLTSTTNIFMHWGSSLTPTPPLASNLTITYQATAAETPVLVTTTDNPAVNTFNQLNITTGTTFEVNGIVTVVAKFQTKLNDDNKGLFYRQYPVENNQNNTVFLTNLRPTFARELFPCLDEPQYSGQITLTLIYPDSWAVAATTSVVTSTSNAGLNTTVFNTITTTPNNLAFFLATNMRQKNYSVDRSTTQLNFWSRKGLSSSTFSANVQFLAEFYYFVEDVLGTPLPLGNLTVVMVPGLEEPLAGYGVIFIREDNYAQDYSNPQMEGLFKTNVAPVVYQYLRQFSEFNVRPSSWSDYWMSQAIAKYLHYVILNTVMPIFDFKTDLEVVARQNALSLDSQPDAKPLNDSSITIDSTASIQAMVNDPLKSLKGATILNMLDQSFPPGTVFAAIISFLKANMNTAVTSDKFLSEIKLIQNSKVLSPSAKKALDKTLGYWFNSTVYPLETVKIHKYTIQDSPGVVNFTTTAFCSLLNPSCSTTLPGIYYLSATVGSKTNNRYYAPRQDFWATNDAASATVNTYIDVQDNDWVVANMKSGGYYRSNYDENNWERIIDALNSGDQRLLGRTQLLDDAFALALSSSDALNYNITVRLAVANLGNTLYKDWVPVQRGLRGFNDILLGLDIYTSYKDFAAGYFLNLDGFLQNRTIDAFEKTRIQALFLDDMCENDIPGYRASALANLTDLLKGTLPNTVPSSAYDALACCGARYNSSLEAQALWNILADSTLNYYSRRFASVALGCLSNYTDVAQLFNTMTMANIQLKPYIQIALENVAEKNPVSFLANFTKLAEKFQSKLGAASVASLIVRAGRKVNNNTHAAVLNELSNNANVDPVVQTAAQNTKKAIGYRVTWLYNSNKTLVSALKSHTFPSGATSGAYILTVTCLLVFLPSLLIMLVPL